MAEFLQYLFAEV